MITGRVGWLLEATVGVEIEDADGHLHQFRCVLDTGFTGYIALPAADIRHLGLSQLGHRNTTLLDSYSTDLPMFQGIVFWHGQPTSVEVLETQQESVIGMSLLEYSTVTIEVWDGGSVMIEPR